MQRALIVLALVAGTGIAAIYYGSLPAHHNEPVRDVGAATLPREQRQHQIAAADSATEHTSTPSGAESPDASRAAQTSKVADAETSQSDEIKVQLQGIQADYREMAEEIYHRSPPLIEPAERAALTLLQNEKRSDLARVLTPAEVELFEARINETPAPQRR